MTRAILFALAVAVCCTRCIGPAVADQTSRALHALCGPRGYAIVELVRQEAHRQLISPVLLARVIASESTCSPDADSGHGDIGLGQIRLGGNAVKGATREQLLDPAVNVRLTAAHLAWALVLCRDRVRSALSVYRGFAKCRDSAGSRRAMGMRVE